MQSIVVTGKPKPEDRMDRPYVVVPYATWLTLENAGKREAELLAQLAAEKARAAAVLADFEAYMREHQVLMAKQTRGRV